MYWVSFLLTYFSAIKTSKLEKYEERGGAHAKPITRSCMSWKTLCDKSRSGAGVDGFAGLAVSALGMSGFGSGANAAVTGAPAREPPRPPAPPFPADKPVMDGAGGTTSE